jgi:CHAT domain-containing protein
MLPESRALNDLRKALGAYELWCDNIEFSAFAAVDQIGIAAVVLAFDDCRRPYLIKTLLKKVAARLASADRAGIFTSIAASSGLDSFAANQVAAASQAICRNQFSKDPSVQPTMQEHKIDILTTVSGWLSGQTQHHGIGVYLWYVDVSLDLCDNLHHAIVPNQPLLAIATRVQLADELSSRFEELLTHLDALYASRGFDSMGVEERIDILLKKADIYLRMVECRILGGVTAAKKRLLLMRRALESLLPDINSGASDIDRIKAAIAAMRANPDEVYVRQVGKITRRLGAIFTALGRPKVAWWAYQLAEEIFQHTKSFGSYNDQQIRIKLRLRDLLEWIKVEAAFLPAAAVVRAIQTLGFYLESNARSFNRSDTNRVTKTFIHTDPKSGALAVRDIAEDLSLLRSVRLIEDALGRKSPPSSPASSLDRNLQYLLMYCEDEQFQQVARAAHHFAITLYVCLDEECLSNLRELDEGYAVLRKAARKIGLKLPPLENSQRESYWQHFLHGAVAIYRLYSPHRAFRLLAVLAKVQGELGLPIAIHTCEEAAVLADSLGLHMRSARQYCKLAELYEGMSQFDTALMKANSCLEQLDLCVNHLSSFFDLAAAYQEKAEIQKRLIGLFSRCGGTAESLLIASDASDKDLVRLLKRAHQEQDELLLNEASQLLSYGEAPVEAHIGSAAWRILKDKAPGLDAAVRTTRANAKKYVDELKNENRATLVLRYLAVDDKLVCAALLCGNGRVDGQVLVLSSNWKEVRSQGESLQRRLDARDTAYVNRHLAYLSQSIIEPIASHISVADEILFLPMPDNQGIPLHVLGLDGHPLFAAKRVRYAPSLHSLATAVDDGLSRHKSLVVGLDNDIHAASEINRLVQVLPEGTFQVRDGDHAREWLSNSFCYRYLHVASHGHDKSGKLLLTIGGKDIDLTDLLLLSSKGVHFLVMNACHSATSSDFVGSHLGLATGFITRGGESVLVAEGILDPECALEFGVEVARLAVEKDPLDATLEAMRTVWTKYADVCRVAPYRIFSRA